MAVQLPRGYQNTYTSGVLTNVQQMRSVVAPYVRHRSYRSQNNRWVFSGAVNMTTTSPSSGASNLATGLTGFPHRKAQSYADIPYNVVWVGIKEGYINTTTERSDQVQLNGQVNMGADIMQKHAYAYQRWYDDQVIAAITGAKIGNAMTSQNLPASQTITASLVGNSAISLDEEWISTNIHQKFTANHAQGMVVSLVPPEIIGHFYSIESYKNRDYSPNYNLMASRLFSDFILPEWMSVRWAISTRLLRSNSNKTVTIPFFIPGTVAYKENQMLRPEVGIRSDLHGSPIQYSCQVFGAATRLWDEKVIRLNLTLSA